MQIEFHYQNLYLAVHQGCDQWRMRGTAIRSAIEPTSESIYQKVNTVAGTVWNPEDSPLPEKLSNSHPKSRGRPTAPTVDISRVQDYFHAGHTQIEVANILGISLRHLQRQITQFRKKQGEQK